MLTHRLPRWPNIKTTLVQGIMFAVIVLIEILEYRTFGTADIGYRSVFHPFDSNFNQ